jgi:hypothetical protein
MEKGFDERHDIFLDLWIVPIENHGLCSEAMSYDEFSILQRIIDA